MADKKEATTVLERTYNVPLRREYLKAPKYKRTKKAVSALRQFLARHMKTDLSKIKIMNSANLELWKHGIKNPPHHVKVMVTKDSEGMVRAELFGVKKEGSEEEKKKRVKKSAEKKETGEKTEERKEKQ